MGETQANVGLCPHKTAAQTGRASQLVLTWGNYDAAEDLGPLGVKGRGPKSEKSFCRRWNQDHVLEDGLRVSQAKRGGTDVPGKGNRTEEGPEVKG